MACPCPRVSLRGAWEATTVSCTLLRSKVIRREVLSFDYACACACKSLCGARILGGGARKLGALSYELGAGRNFTATIDEHAPQLGFGTRLYKKRGCYPIAADKLEAAAADAQT